VIEMFLAALGFVLIWVASVLVGMVELFTLPPSSFIVTSVTVAVALIVLSVVLRVINAQALQFVLATVAVLVGSIGSLIFFISIDKPLSSLVFAMSTGLFFYSCCMIPALSKEGSSRERQLRPMPHMMWVYPLSVATYLTELSSPPAEMPIASMLLIGVMGFLFFGKHIRSL